MINIRPFVLVLGLSSSVHAALEFTLLQNANLGNGDVPNCMTPDGTLLAGYSGGVAAIWNAQGQVTSKGPGTIFGVNANGTVFVGQTNDYHPAIWKNGLNAARILTTGEFGAAYTITADGLHSAGYSSDYAAKFDHTLQTQTNIVFPTDNTSSIYKITPNGNLVVGYWEPEYLLVKGFVKDGQNEHEELGSLTEPGNYNYTLALDVSDDGKIIVGVSRTQLFRWTRDTGIVGLGPHYFDGGGHRVVSISGDGRTIVGNAHEVSADLRVGGFVWDETQGLRDLKTVLESSGLDLAGWFLTAVSSISFNGDVIAGEGILNINGYDYQRGWVVRGFSQFFPPTILLTKEGNQYVVKFSGILQESDDLGILDVWQDVGGNPTAQYIVPSPVAGRKFYRARSY